MAKTNNHICLKFSAILGCVLVVLLWAAPCSATTTWVVSGQTYDIDEPFDDYVIVYGGTLNLHPGADLGYLDVYEGTLNIYGGKVHNPILILSHPDILVTYYGAGFELNKVPLVDENGEPLSQFTPDPYALHELTGTYESGEEIDLRFYVWGYVPMHLAVSAPTVVEVPIDIKPGSETNPINLKSKGLVPVAVLAFDGAPEIDPTTVVFAGAAPVRWTLEDVDGDGDEDIVFHFKTQELDLNQNSTEATLTAQLAGQLMSLSTSETSNGATVSGTDKVQVLSSKSKK